MIENGQRSPTLKNAAKISKALGILNIGTLWNPDNWDDITIQKSDG